MIGFIFKTLALLFLIFFLSCKDECEKVPNQFNSFEEAKKIIPNFKFSITENIYTIKSSWIDNIKYFSCDNQTGYLMLTTDGKTYLYADIPIDVWNDFKNAQSYGSYYNKNIKGKYGFSHKLKRKLK